MQQTHTLSYAGGWEAYLCVCVCYEGNAGLLSNFEPADLETDFQNVEIIGLHLQTVAKALQNLGECI